MIKVKECNVILRGEVSTLCAELATAIHTLKDLIVESGRDSKTVDQVLRFWCEVGLKPESELDEMFEHFSAEPHDEPPAENPDKRESVKAAFDNLLKAIFEGIDDEDGNG